MVGSTARSDCRGPYVLKGRRTTTGSSYDRWNDSASWSAAVLDAAYGYCAWSAWVSRIGSESGVP